MGNKKVHHFPSLGVLIHIKTSFSNAFTIPVCRKLRVVELFPYKNKPKIIILIRFKGTSLVVQWLKLQAPNAGSPGSIPGQGTTSHMPQLRPDTAK